MKRFSKVVIVALALGATAAPVMAQAQGRPDHREWRQDYRGDRYDRRPERRDNRSNAPRYDRRDERRYERPNVRPARPAYQPNRWDRSNRDWWRGRPEFRDYRGVRPGQWYAPGYGYYRVEPRYANYRWRQGAYLPAAYRTYYVRDPAFYGLRPAPRGYRYVHANNDILLVAVATGLIASVLSGVY